MACLPYRIEILFVGDAPEDELERARILAGGDVAKAILALSQALQDAGMTHLVKAQSVRATPKGPRKPKLIAAE